MGTITRLWREVLARQTRIFRQRGNHQGLFLDLGNKEDEWLPKTALIHFEKLNF
jgi:hypothetical protein